MGGDFLNPMGRGAGVGGECACTLVGTTHQQSLHHLDSQSKCTEIIYDTRERSSNSFFVYSAFTFCAIFFFWP